MSLRYTPSRTALRVFLSSCAITCLFACNGKTHKGADGPRPGTPQDHRPGSYVAPPGAKAFIEGAPGRTNAPKLTLRIYGPDLAIYRYKFGPAAGTDCGDTAGYSPDVTATIPLVLDQAALSEGDYLLCVVGADTHHEWQATAQATTAAWTIDRKGPDAFAVNAVEFPDQPAGSVKFSWSAPAPEAAAAFEIALVNPDEGCAAPLKTYRVASATQYVAESGVPGGRYAVCVTAFDDVGNATPATNNGQILLDRPSAVHFAYYKGVGAEAKTLVHATRTGTQGAWHQAVVPLPTPGRYGSRAALQLDAHGKPVIAYQMIAQPDLSLPKLSLAVAFGGEGDAFTHRQLYAAAVPGGAGLQAALAIAPNGEAHVAHLAQEGGQAQLIYTRAAGSDNAVTVKLESAGEAAEIFQDSSLATDAKGRLHLAFVRGGKLYYRVQDGSNWGAEQTLDTAACKSVTLASVGVGGEDKRYVAYLCSHKDGRVNSCALNLATAAVDGTGVTWTHKTVATLDPAADCLPFNSARPGLAVDGKGRAHLLYRYTDASHAGAWDVAYALGADDAAAAPVALGDWGPLTGFPLVALDASDRVYALYLSGGTVKFAYGETGAQLKPEAVSFDSDAGAGGPFELADLVVHGGRGRGYQAFGN